MEKLRAIHDVWSMAAIDSLLIEPLIFDGDKLGGSSLDGVLCSPIFLFLFFGFIVLFLPDLVYCMKMYT